MKKKNHALSANQCIENSFDSDAGTLGVSIKETAIEISLDHKEDSIVIHNNVISGSLQAGEVADLSGTKQISIYSTPGSVVKGSPLNEGDLWVILGTISGEGVLTVNVCVMRLMCSEHCHIVAV